MTNRRQLLKFLSVAPLLNPLRTLAQPSGSFAGKFLVTIQARGAWDTTCFCDPKENQPGELPITNWSHSDGTQRAGNIDFAPFAENQRFFTKHAQNMLVINGVDAQTNSHSIGETVNWSGRTALGFPTLTAMYAAQFGAHLPMAYVTFGGFNRTENLLRATQLGWSVSDIGELLRPNQHNNMPMMDPELWALITRVNATNALPDNNTIAGNRSSRQAYRSSIAAIEPLKDFADTLPTQDQWESRTKYGFLRQQVQFTIAAFKSGAAIAADLVQGGFDSHEENDLYQEIHLRELSTGIDFLWDSAEAAGIADRLVVVIGSDFSRTPYYNSGRGKDHWSVGSFIVMEKGVSYTNRQIAGTDEGQNALAIDPQTLQPSGFGVKMLTSHVHTALRQYMGLEDTNFSRLYPFRDSVHFRFFG